MSSDSTDSTFRRAWRFVVLAALMIFSSISLTWYNPYVRPYWQAMLGLLLSLGLSAALSRSPRWRARLGKLSERVSKLTPSSRRLLIAWGFVAPMILALWVLDPIPHIPDGFAYLFQATLFSMGKLWAASPSLPEFFPAPWSVDLGGRVFTVFPPGWPMLLALGVATGVPALVNPILGALSLGVMWHLWKELFDARRANFALALCALSPFFLFMSASFMSHNASLLASSAFVLAFLKGARKASLAWGSLAALAMAFQILVRPVSAFFVFTAVVGFFAIARRSRASLQTIGCAIAGAGIGAAAYAIYNRLLVGEWGVPPLYFLTPANRFGFGADIGIPWASSFPTPGHTPFRALLNLNFNMAVMNNDLFGWPLVSLLFAMICLLFSRLAWQHRLCASIIAASILMYAGYWYNGVAFGARFYYCLLPYLCILTIEGILATPDLLRALSSRFVQSHLHAFVGFAVIGFTLYGACVYIPRIALVGPYWNQRKISHELYRELDAIVKPGDLVFVQSDSDERYNPVFVKNAVDIESGPVVYAWDRGDAINAQLIAKFPERRIVRWRYPIERLKQETPSAQFRRFFQPTRDAAR